MIKVIVQNGAAHGLTRREAEAIVGILPRAWSGTVKSIVLYQGDDAGVHIEFYPKEKILGLFWPHASQTVATPTKSQAIEELLMSFAIVAEIGYLPKHITSSVRRTYVSDTNALKEKCMQLLRQNVG